MHFFDVVNILVAPVTRCATVSLFPPDNGSQWGTLALRCAVNPRDICSLGGLKMGQPVSETDLPK